MRPVPYIAVFLAAFVLATPCHAVIVLRKASDEPIRGILVEESTTHVIVNEVLPSGELKKWILTRSEIDDVIRAVSPDQLAGLHRDNAEGYRQYAEDLAVKTEDPEARAMAIRLYVIAAHLAPEQFGRSCLLGAAGLARTPEEERAFRAMAFVLDPEHEATLLKQTKLVASNFATVNKEQRLELRKAVRMLRSGKLPEARRMFARESVQKSMTSYTHIASHADYEAAIQAKGRLPAALLRKFVTLELALADIGGSASEAEEDDVTPWSQIIARRATQPVKPLTLEAITEFDPRDCHFVDGKWVNPDTEE